MRIGVTGAIGAGKSFFTRALAEALARLTEKKIHRIDADLIARMLIESRASDGSPGPLLRRILDAFGADLLPLGGPLDRTLLAERAFASEETAKLLNAIVHPTVLKEIERRTAPPDEFFILDVPLLFESGGNRLCDITIAVTAPRETRLIRVAGRFRDFAEREARQWPEEKKAEAADEVVDNSGSSADLERKAAEIAKKLVPRSERI